MAALVNRFPRSFECFLFLPVLYQVLSIWQNQDHFQVSLVLWRKNLQLKRYPHWESPKSNFLLKGYFNKKKKAEAKKAAELKKEEDKRIKQQLKFTADSIKNATLIIPVKKIPDGL